MWGMIVSRLVPTQQTVAGMAQLFTILIEGGHEHLEMIGVASSGTSHTVSKERSKSMRAGVIAGTVGGLLIGYLCGEWIGGARGIASALLWAAAWGAFCGLIFKS